MPAQDRYVLCVGMSTFSRSSRSTRRIEAAHDVSAYLDSSKHLVDAAPNSLVGMSETASSQRIQVLASVSRSHGAASSSEVDLRHFFSNQDVRQSLTNKKSRCWSSKKDFSSEDTHKDHQRGAQMCICLFLLDGCFSISIRIAHYTHASFWMQGFNASAETLHPDSQISLFAVSPWSACPLSPTNGPISELSMTASNHKLAISIMFLLSVAACFC